MWPHASKGGGALYMSLGIRLGASTFLLSRSFLAHNSDGIRSLTTKRNFTIHPITRDERPRVCFCHNHVSRQEQGKLQQRLLPGLQHATAAAVAGTSRQGGVR